MAGMIDREAEAAELRSLADSGGRKLALLTGRRRVGKTWLLSRLWPSDRAFYFTASATSPAINRRVLVDEAAAWAGEALRSEDLPTWRAVLRTLLELHPERDLVVVLDEFQYLAVDEVGLREVASELNAVWEGRLRREGGLLLILSGSAVRTLEALASGGSPLFGRLDWRRELLPFDYFDTAAMVPAYRPPDQVRTYAAFGGVPRYTSAIDTRRPLQDEIVSLLLTPTGEVRLQLETVLEQEEGLRDVTKYRGVLGAIGTGRRAIGEIAAALGQRVDTPLRRMVAQLEDLGLVQSVRSFGEPSNRALRYRIADPALRFHHGLVLPNESAIAASGAEAVWKERLARVFPSYVGQQVFEDVVAQAWRRFRGARGLPAVEEWGAWAGRDRDGRDLEIDVVARLLDGRMLTGSVKFRGRQAGASMVVEHLDALRRLAGSGRGWAREALDPEAPMLFVSASGFAASFDAVARELGHPILRWELADLLPGQR